MVYILLVISVQAVGTLDPQLHSEELVSELYDQLDVDGSFEEKAQRALELGRQYLGVQNAHLTTIDQAADHWKAKISTDGVDGEFPPGAELDLGRTYCRRTLDEDSKIALHDAPAQGWADDIAFETHGLHCYLGTRLEIEGETYGTLCFVNQAPREDPFDDAELMFVELIARMLERELEREHHEVQLLRQSNLSLVLNRVLRHNLRNNVTVIGGYVKMMADRLEEGDKLGDVALEKIDNLIDMGNTARELDQFIASESDPEPSDIVSRVRHVVDSVADSHPSTTFRVEADEEISANLLPSFDRAIEEVLANAAKHGGDTPTVTVGLQSVPDAVEIRIEDDGPGISEQEIQVLRTGAETPLTHGSGLGLWLVHWIVSSHGGNVEAVVDNSGTRMEITIPRTQTTGGRDELRTLARARDQFEAAFDRAADGMMMVDDETHILEANEAATRLFEGEKTELLGRQIIEFLPKYDEQDTDLEQLIHAGSEQERVTVVTMEGSKYELEYSAVKDVVQGQHLIEGRPALDSYH